MNVKEATELSVTLMYVERSDEYLDEFIRSGIELAPDERIDLLEAQIALKQAVKRINKVMDAGFIRQDQG